MINFSFLLFLSSLFDPKQSALGDNRTQGCIKTTTMKTKPDDDVVADSESIHNKDGPIVIEDELGLSSSFSAIDDDKNDDAEEEAKATVREIPPNTSYRDCNPWQKSKAKIPRNGLDSHCNNGDER